MEKNKVPRRRDAAATRQAILDSARQAFARLGYDGAGVREIASGAGVTAMLVNRYFGSKEKLFEEAVEESMLSTAVVLPEILKSGASGEDIAAVLIRITHANATPLEGFQIMVRSASSKKAAEIAQRLIEKHHQSSVTAALRGNLAPQRAAVMLSLIMGIQIMRQMFGLSALGDSRSKGLARILGPLFQQLLDGKVVDAASPPAAPPR